MTTTRLPSCDRHPDKDGAHTCERCRGRFCAFCVTRPEPGPVNRSCPACSLRGRLVASRPIASAGALAEQLTDVWRYPVAEGGWIALVAGAFMGAVVTELARFGALLFVVAIAILLAAAGYLWMWLLRVVASTADGHDTLPDWPDGDSPADMLTHGLVLCLLLAVCALPAFFAWMGGLSAWPALLVILLAGLSLFPMCMLALAMGGSLRALNPLILVPSLVKLGRGYLVAVAALAAVMAVRLGVEWLLSGVPILGGLVLGVASLYFLVVQARVVGLLYRVYQDELGWFA